MLEVMRAGSNLGFLNKDGSRRLIKRERNWIASALCSDRLTIDGRCTVFAHYPIRPFVEPYAAADLAGVEYRREVSIRLLVKPEPYLSAILSCGKTMQVSIRNLRQRNDRLPIRKCEWSGWRNLADALGVNEFCRDQHDEQKRACINRCHPQAFPARAPQCFASFRSDCCNRCRCAPLHLKQHHQCRQRKDGHKKEKVVAHNRSNDCHLPPGRGKYLIFREFM